MHKAAPSPLCMSEMALPNMWMSSTTNILQEALQAQQYVQNLTAMKMQQMISQSNGEAAPPLMQPMIDPMQLQLLYPHMNLGSLQAMPNMMDQSQMNDVMRKYGILGTGLELVQDNEAPDDMALILAGMKNRDTDQPAVDSIESDARRNVPVPQSAGCILPEGDLASGSSPSGVENGSSPSGVENEVDRLPSEKKQKKRLSNGGEELPVRKKAKAYHSVD